jgi:hypothetical protein
MTRRLTVPQGPSEQVASVPIVSLAVAAMLPSSRRYR